MKPTIHHLQQGTEAWLAHRNSHFNASDAPSMMGASRYRTRTALVQELATGIRPEVSEVQERLFERGHAAEAATRPTIEEQIGEDLFPATLSLDVDGLPLSASLDGWTMGGETVFECKLWNEKLAEQVRNGLLEPHYYWQLEQQLLVSGAERVIFVTSDGESRMEQMEYRPVEGRAAALIAGWKQLEADVAAYEAPAVSEVVPKQARIPGEALPAIFVQVHGQVTVTENFHAFEARALDFLDHELIRSPQTDDDFGALEDQIKEIKRAEAALDASGAQVLGQVETIDTFMRRKDQLSKLLRDNRLLAEKLLTSEKERRRGEIVEAGKQAVIAHYQQINATMGAHALLVPLREITADLGAAIKGKRSLSSMQDAVDSLAAQHKVTASQTAERVRACVRVLEMEVGSYGTLFPDAVQLCAQKQPEDLRNLITARIAEHQQKEQARLDAERERIRKEEADRLERERRQSEIVEAAEAVTKEVAPAAVASPAPQAPQAPVAADRPGVRVKLGDINAAIAPLSINAEGLAQLGFLPVGSERSAKLYDAAQVPAMCQAMQRVLAKAAVADALPRAA